MLGALGEALSSAVTQSWQIPGSGSSPEPGVLLAFTPCRYEEMMQVVEREPFGAGKIMRDTLHMDQVIKGCRFPPPEHDAVRAAL